MDNQEQQVEVGATGAKPADGSWKYVAVIDGTGPHAEVSLRLEEIDGDGILELSWPETWPRWVNTKFLQEHGYAVITA